MSLFEWSDKFSVEITSIDEQHKKLVNFINNLDDAMIVGKGKHVIGGILDGLVHYTIEHFDYEEQLFDTHGYPDADAHKKEHKDLVAQVARFKQSFKSGKEELTKDLMDFLKDWLMNHIMDIDKKYSPFLKDKNIS